MGIAAQSALHRPLGHQPRDQVGALQWTSKAGRRTTRDPTSEDGGSPFALTVPKRRGTAVFVHGCVTSR